MSMFAKLGGLIGAQIQLGIGSAAALLKWTASLVSFRNKADGNYVGVALKTIEVWDTTPTRKTTVGMPTGAAGDLTFNLPTTAGSATQVLQTDGSGNTSWVSAGSTAACVTEDTTSLAFGTASPVTAFTLPANAVIRDIRVVVDTLFNGTSTVTVGVVGTTSKYTASTDCDLTVAGEYVIYPGLAAEGGTNAIILTYSAGGASAGAARIIVAYSIPG